VFGLSPDTAEVTVVTLPNEPVAQEFATGVSVELQVVAAENATIKTFESVIPSTATLKEVLPEPLAFVVTLYQTSLGEIFPLSVLEIHVPTGLVYPAPVVVVEATVVPVILLQLVFSESVIAPQGLSLAGCANNKLLTESSKTKSKHEGNFEKEKKYVIKS
jgi:hypothetical protein